VTRTRTSPTITIAGLEEKSATRGLPRAEATAFTPREVHYGAT
jgi:hypothetical protein